MKHLINRNRCCILLFVLLFYWAMELSWAGIYEIPNRPFLDHGHLYALGGEILCGSNQNTLLVEFPATVSNNEIRRFFPNSRFIASTARFLLGAEPPTQDEIDHYRTWTNVQNELIQYSNQYPTYFTLDTIGFSVQNRPLLYVKISDSVSIQRDVPRLYLVAGTHGNEMISVEVLMNFIQWLLNQVQTDTTIQRLLRQCELHLVPVLNPDGFTLQQRQNANLVDLNRNFRYYWSQFATQYGTAPLSEPETNALDSLLQVVQPILGISYHSYGELILRPYSGRSRACPSNPVFQNVSQLYWQHTPSYTQMYGWQLYLHGGEHNDHCISNHWFPSITIEVWRGPNYNPPTDSILSVSIPHRNAIVQLMHRITQQQVTGIVRDAHTGLPILNARYQILEQLDSSYEYKSVNPQTGRFRSLQIASVITMRFQAEGYLDRNVSFTIPTTPQPLEQDVYLFTSSCFLSGNITLFSHFLNDSVPIRIQNQIRYVRSNENFVISNLSAGVDTVVIGDSIVTEQLKIPIHLISSETTYVSGNVARMLAPLTISGRWEQGIAIIQWQRPYTDSTAQTRIRGYRIWRDTTMVVPWLLDTIFAEPMSGNELPRVYLIQTLYYGGISPFSDSVVITPPFTLVKNRGDAVDFFISKPYPNPFNESVSINTQIRYPTNITITVHNVLGQVVYSQRYDFQSGNKTIGWKPSDSKHTAGIYFLTVQFDSFIQQHKIVYLP